MLRYTVPMKTWAFWSDTLDNQLRRLTANATYGPGSLLAAGEGMTTPILFLHADAADKACEAFADGGHAPPAESSAPVATRKRR